MGIVINGCDLCILRPVVDERTSTTARSVRMIKTEDRPMGNVILGVCFVGILVAKWHYYSVHRKK